MIIIHSGGAEGADACFGNIGVDLGYEVIHHSFKGHRVNGLGKGQKHNLFQLYLADMHLRKANESLRRAFPPKSVYVKRLIQRNLYQVKNSKYVIAVAKLEKNLQSVKGGTGWAVQMGIDQLKLVYVFDDGQTDKWYLYDYGSKDFQPLASACIPSVNDAFAGIGTREISSKGIQAIREFLEFNKQCHHQLKFYTAQYRYDGQDRFDITVKGAVNFAFAPTWDMVKGHKNGTMSDEEYTLKYMAMMEKSIGKNEEAWQDLLSRQVATLVCFCSDGHFCHRYILVDILIRLGAKYMGERELVSKKSLKT